LAFEILFPALYLCRRTRLAAVFCGIALHIGIGVLYPIPVFSGFMLAIYAGLLPESWYRARQNVPVWSPSSRQIAAVAAIWRVFIALGISATGRRRCQRGWRGVGSSW
jgi:hypothetical protein